MVYDSAPFNCFGIYYAPGEYCCSVLKSFTVPNIDMTGNIPYYIRIDYRHKEDEPCIRMFRESSSLTFGALDIEARSMTELRESPFMVKALINRDIINIGTTGKICFDEVIRYGDN